MLRLLWAFPDQFLRAAPSICPAQILRRVLGEKLVSVKHMSDGSVSFLGNWSVSLITGRLMLAARQFLLVILPACACGWLLFRWLISRWGFGLPVPSKWLVGWCERVALITTAWFSVGSRWKVGVSQAYVRWLGQFPRQLVRKSHHWTTDAGGSHVPSRGLDGWC